MIKNWLKTALVIVLIFNISGCAELRKKFIRKKKADKRESSFYVIEKYKPKPSDERYQDHYVLWHNWHLELERTEGGSYLRDIRAATEALKHLTAMQGLLIDEKAKELDTQIKHMERLLERLKQTQEDITKNVHSRRTVEQIGRVVVNNFSYNRVKDSLKGTSPN